MHRLVDEIGAFAFVVPALAFLLVFNVYPFFRTFQLSATDWDGIQRAYHYVGLAHYARVLADGAWWRSMLNGAILALAALVVMQTGAFVIAVLAQRAGRATQIYRTSYFLPVMLSPVIVAVVWRWILDPYNGLLNQMLAYAGLGGMGRAWLAEPITALAAVSVVSMWQGFGHPFLLFVSGLQAIPAGLYEAASVDGAGGWQQFRRITIPLMLPIIGAVSVLTVLGAMQLMALVLVLTFGGPGYATDVPGLRIYREAFNFLEFGYASALSVVFGAILFTGSLAQFVAIRRRMRGVCG